MNGLIQAKIIYGSGLDEHGEPTKGTETWTKKFECTYKPNMKRNNGRYEDGVFTQSEYEIIVFDMSFTGAEINLFNNKGSLICNKPVISIQELEAVQRIKIVV